MTWIPEPPVIALASGQYFSEQQAQVTSPNPTATLHYTLSGALRQDTDPIVTSGASVAITRSATLTVAAFITGAPPSMPTIANYDLKVPTPSIAPTSGAYSAPTAITLSSAMGNVTLAYTLDGSEPTAAATVYSTPFAIAESLTVKAVAQREGWTPSDAAYASYWISAGVLDPPTIRPSGGTYAGERAVSLSTAATAASIRFTTDGSEPTPASPVYVRPFVVTRSLTVKARVFKAGYEPSTVASAAYIIDGPDTTGIPTIAPGGGRFVTSQLVTVTGPAGATLRYTTNGGDPSETDPTIASGGTVLVDRSLVLKVRAWIAGAQPSPVQRADFVITGAIAAGEYVCVALKADGTVWTWGDNAFGALGDGLGTDRNTPVQVFSGAIRIAAGVRHTLALKADGTVWAWGQNFAGELGDGTTTMRRTPVQVQGLTGVVAIAAGFGYSLALKSDGTVWTWGNNWAGQLGDGTTTLRLAPVQVIGIGGVSAIAARDVSSFALVTDGGSLGRLWSWGGNAGRQLGDQSTINKLVPVTAVVPILQSVHAGFDWVGGRDANGTVWLWGTNTVGQLGTGTTSESEDPGTLAAPWILSGVLLGGGWGHVLLVDRNRARWGWGANAFEQTGTGLSGDVLTPAVASAPLGIQASDGGMNHSIGLRADGWISTWDGGAQGQLGNGSNINTAVPVTVTGLRLAENDWLVSDADGDGLLAWREYELGSDPLNADTNGDGVPDGIEVLADSDVANIDLDDDSLSTRAELLLGTDPLRGDTDGDGVVDGLDVFPLDASRSALPPPDPNDQTPPIITLTEPANATPIP